MFAFITLRKSDLEDATTYWAVLKEATISPSEHFLEGILVDKYKPIKLQTPFRRSTKE